MASKASDSRPGPTVCRCCFAEGCYKDISTEYFWMGKREVYSEMLTETFDVTIAYSQTGGPNSNSRLICEPCISRLRDAADFKRQVQECEKVFLLHLAQPTSSIDFEIEEPSIREEVKLERVKLEAKMDDDDDFEDNIGFADDDDDDLDDQPLMKLASKVPKEESDELLKKLLLDDEKKLEKRKSSTKVKAAPAKKIKKKESPKPSVSKPQPKTVADKKKKGSQEKRSSSRVIVLRKEADPDHEEPSKEASNIKLIWKRKSTISINNRSPILIPIKKSTIPIKKSIIPIKKSVISLKKEDKKPVQHDVSWKRICKTQANEANASFILEHSNAIPFKYNRGKFMCAYCDFTCPAMDQLRSHCESHDKLTGLFKKGIIFPLRIEITDLSCSICHLRVDDIDNLKTHLESEHSKKPPSDEDNDGSIIPFILTKNELNCVHCKKSFITFMNLLLHMNMHYQNHVCHVCGKGFANDQKLKRHKMMHDDENCGCPKCDEILPTKAARMRHIAVVHGPKNRYRCPICDAHFSSYHMRLRHLDREHGQKSEYPCGQCSSVFSTGMCRSAHIRAVHKKLKRKRKKNRPLDE